MQISAGNEKLETWFGLSYAAFAVLPRVLMCAMPDEWQGKMADLLNEIDTEFPNLDICSKYIIQLQGKDGKFIRAPGWLLNYRHPFTADINACRKGNKRHAD